MAKLLSGTRVYGTANVDSTINAGGNINFVNNNIRLTFATVNTSANSYFIQQNDDNFVFYSTNTAYGQRAIWSIFANSITSNLTFSVPINVSGNVGVTTNTITLGTSTSAANGYTYLPNGIKMNWGWVSANSTVGTATFSSAYTTTYNVIAVSNSAVATYQAAVTTQNTTTASIRTANATSTNVFWQALGV